MFRSMSLISPLFGLFEHVVFLWFDLKVLPMEVENRAYWNQINESPTDAVDKIDSEVISANPLSDDLIRIFT